MLVLLVSSRDPTPWSLTPRWIGRYLISSAAAS
jgi:hypothetical protein